MSINSRVEFPGIVVHSPDGLPMPDEQTFVDQWLTPECLIIMNQRDGCQPTQAIELVLRYTWHSDIPTGDRYAMKAHICNFYHNIISIGCIGSTQSGLVRDDWTFRGAPSFQECWFSGKDRTIVRTRLFKRSSTHITFRRTSFRGLRDTVRESRLVIVAFGAAAM
jgi:hypothetical protein